MMGAYGRASITVLNLAVSAMILPFADLAVLAGAEDRAEWFACQ
jgi:hypothetical protein